MQDANFTHQFDLLTERIDAQVQAHEKYSLAFIRILTTLDAIAHRLETMAQVDGEALRELLKDVNAVMEELRRHHESAKELKQSVDAQIKECQEWLETLARELEAQRNLVETIPALVQHLTDSTEIDHRRMAESLSQAQAHLKDALDRLETLQDSAAAFKDIPEQMSTLMETRHGWRIWWEKSRIFVYAVGTVLVALQALVQLGLLQMKWPWSP